MMQSLDETELCFPQLNTSCRKPQPRLSEVTCLSLILIISLLTVALNLLVIISVSHFRQLHTSTNLLLLSLAASDLLLGLVVFPIEVFKRIVCWFSSDLMCVLFEYLTLLVTSVSIGNMVLISVDRYVAICRPLQYSTRVTVRKVQAFVGLCWFCSSAYSCFMIKDHLVQSGRLNSCYGECVLLTGQTVGAVDVAVSFIVPIAVIVCLYVRVFVVAVSQARALRSHVTATTFKLSVTAKSIKSELKAARTLGVVVVIFLLCFCPFYCLSFLFEYNENITLEILVVFLFALNPFLNPLIYALFYPWFRKAIRLIVTLQVLQPGSRETSML